VCNSVIGCVTVFAKIVDGDVTGTSSIFCIYSTIYMYMYAGLNFATNLVTMAP